MPRVCVTQQIQLPASVTFNSPLAGPLRITDAAGPFQIGTALVRHDSQRHLSICVCVCAGGVAPSERVADDEVREVCSSAGL